MPRETAASGQSGRLWFWIAGAVLMTAISGFASAPAVAGATDGPVARVASASSCGDGPCLTEAAGDDRCLPIDMPSRDALFGSKRKVFAHFFGAVFPLSFDNLPPDKDFYNTAWLRPVGRWTEHGGFLRARPLGAEPADPALFRRVNYEREIRLAIARGITGFAYEFGSLQCSSQLSASTTGCLSHLEELLASVQRVDDRFKLMLMPGGLTTDEIKEAVRVLYSRPGMFHIDGKLVVAPFNARVIPASDWGRMLSDLRDEGKPVYYLPTFLSIPQDIADQFAPIADGIGKFSTADVRQGWTIAREAGIVRAEGRTYMAGVSPQNYKPKDFTYFEARGSRAFRSGWEAAILNKADFIQLTTWNDFSESTQVAPYTDASLSGSIGTGYYNLNGYYASWYLTGKKPKIVRDMVALFYRERVMGDAASRLSAQAELLPPSARPVPPVVEIVGVLTKPGTLMLSIGGETYAFNGKAGMNSFSVPAASGYPVASLVRQGQTILSFRSDKAINGAAAGPDDIADLTYWSASATPAGICSIRL